MKIKIRDHIPQKWPKLYAQLMASCLRPGNILEAVSTYDSFFVSFVKMKIPHCEIDRPKEVTGGKKECSYHAYFSVTKILPQ